MATSKRCIRIVNIPLETTGETIQKFGVHARSVPTGGVQGWIHGKLTAYKSKGDKVETSEIGDSDEIDLSSSLVRDRKYQTATIWFTTKELKGKALLAHEWKDKEWRSTIHSWIIDDQFMELTPL